MIDTVGRIYITTLSKHYFFVVIKNLSSNAFSLCLIKKRMSPCIKFLPSFKSFKIGHAPSLIEVCQTLSFHAALVQFYKLNNCIKSTVCLVLFLAPRKVWRTSQDCLDLLGHWLYHHLLALISSWPHSVHKFLTKFK